MKPSSLDRSKQDNTAKSINMEPMLENVSFDLRQHSNLTVVASDLRTRINIVRSREKSADQRLSNDMTTANIYLQCTVHTWHRIIVRHRDEAPTGNIDTVVATARR